MCRGSRYRVCVSEPVKNSFVATVLWDPWIHATLDIRSRQSRGTYSGIIGNSLSAKWVYKILLERYQWLGAGYRARAGEVSAGHLVPCGWSQPAFGWVPFQHVYFLIHPKYKGYIASFSRFLSEVIALCVAVYSVFLWEGSISVGSCVAIFCSHCTDFSFQMKDLNL